MSSKIRWGRAFNLITGRVVAHIYIKCCIIDLCFFVIVIIIPTCVVDKLKEKNKKSQHVVPSTLTNGKCIDEPKSENRTCWS